MSVDGKHSDVQSPDEVAGIFQKSELLHATPLKCQHLIQLSVIQTMDSVPVNLNYESFFSL